MYGINRTLTLVGLRADGAGASWELSIAPLGSQLATSYASCECNTLPGDAALLVTNFSHKPCLSIRCECDVTADRHVKELETKGPLAGQLTNAQVLAFSFCLFAYVFFLLANTFYHLPLTHPRTIYTLIKHHELQLKATRTAPTNKMSDKETSTLQSYIDSVSI